MLENTEQEIYPPIIVLAILLLLIVIGALIGGGLMFLAGSVLGYDTVALLESLGQESTAGERNFVRLSAFLNQLFTFLLPSLVLALLLFRRQWARFLSVHIFPNVQYIAMGTLFMFVAFPLAQFLYWFNKEKIAVPQWLVEQDESTEQLILHLLSGSAPYELFLNIFLIGIIPALSEEILFRGVIQKQLSRLFRNGIAGLIVAALLFSAIHFQFQGFLPRFLLGALLGYLFYITGNLWVPVAAHFFNNAIQVLVYHFSTDMRAEFESASSEVLPVPVLLASLLLTIGIGWWFYKLRDV